MWLQENVSISFTEPSLRPANIVKHMSARRIIVEPSLRNKQDVRALTNTVIGENRAKPKVIHGTKLFPKQWWQRRLLLNR